MTTDEELRSQFADILDEEDDVLSLSIVRDMQTVFPSRTPPTALHQRIAVTVEQRRAGASRHWLRGHTVGFPTRRRWMLTALLIAVVATGAGTSGLATAAIGTMRTHLFANPPASPEAAVSVGSMEIPMWGGCAPHSTSAPITTPDGRRIAQLDPIPREFSSSVSVVFTPCEPSQPSRTVPTLPPSPYAWETVRISSVVLYKGPTGSVQLITGQATQEGMRRGLYLGNPAGTLSDGTAVFDLVCTSGCAYRDNIRWLKDGLIVSLSGDMPVAQLKTIASDVILK